MAQLSLSAAGLKCGVRDRAYATNLDGLGLSLTIWPAERDRQQQPLFDPARLEPAEYRFRGVIADRAAGGGRLADTVRLHPLILPASARFKIDPGLPGRIDPRVCSQNGRQTGRLVPWPEAKVRREANQRRIWIASKADRQNVARGNTRHAFGVDENVLPSGKSCSWRGSVSESTNGSILERAEVLETFVDPQRFHGGVWRVSIRRPTGRNWDRPFGALDN